MGEAREWDIFLLQIVLLLNGILEMKNLQNLHCVSYEFCNFKCNFCKVAYRNVDNNYLKIDSFDKIQKILTELLKRGNGFKFTGGEPTLDPYLYESLEFFKGKKGTNIFRYQWF